MKTFFVLLCVVLLVVFACKRSESFPAASQEKFEPKGDASDLVYNPIRLDGTVDSSFLPVIQFDSKEFDFGEINAGDILNHEFKFKNTGTAPLLITDANTSCGCTVPEWSKEPIAPGKEGTITVKFDSKDKEGVQNKEVTIFANTIPNKTVLRIKGVVASTK